LGTDLESADDDTSADWRADWRMDLRSPVDGRLPQIFQESDRVADGTSVRVRAK